MFRSSLVGQASVPFAFQRQQRFLVSDLSNLSVRAALEAMAACLAEKRRQLEPALLAIGAAYSSSHLGQIFGLHIENDLTSSANSMVQPQQHSSTW
jgi:hypothetical protein